ncbi:IS1182 family transposase [bacterium]|nr:IS1182 family transposase [bacterium]
MSKTFRKWAPDQMWLLPPSPRDWLEDGHLVYVRLDVVGEMDLAPFFERYRDSVSGQPPFHPQMMVTLLLYAYCKGVFSSRKIMSRCREDIAFRVIVGEDIPDFRTISDFRKDNLEHLQSLFVQTLLVCQQAGLVKLGRVALDGSKVKANASRHKAMSYERMLSEEQRLQQEIADLLAAAKQADEDEDARFGDRHGEELPDELKRRETRLEKVRQAREAVAEQARQKARQHVEQMKAEGRQPRTDPDKVVPQPTDQRNFTDPESKIMKVSNKGFDQCGNAQIVVDENQVILAADVTNQANDVRQVEPLLEQLQSNVAAGGLQGELKEFLADAGYYSDSNLQTLLETQLDPYLATGRLKHNEQLPPAPRGRIPDELSPKQRMARKLRTKRGRETYAKRKWMVEPVFGQLKACHGFRQFLLRGLKKMQGEFTLLCLTHNLLKAFAAGRA